jgi:hypothetical protein
VSVTIDGETVVVNVTNGTAVFDLTNMTNATPGEYVVEITYSGDKNHTNVTVNRNVTIPKYENPISIVVYDDYVGNVTKVTVNVADGLLNNVTIQIDGVTYTNKSNAGVAEFYIEGLSAGAKTVIASYAGDHDYLANSTTANFTIMKVASSVEAAVDPINVGEVAVINITVPSDIKSRVVITVDGVNYTAEIKDGKATLEISKLSNGTYTVEVVYLENAKYLESNNTLT